jgi:hypothetical protein
VASESTFELDASELDRLMSAAAQWSEVSEAAINKVFKGDGADYIVKCIDALMPKSGRRFKGHTSGVKGTNWSRITPGNLQVTIGAVTKRLYVYFPDDGSNTKRHAGNQHFF